MGIGNIANTGMRAAMSDMEVISNNIANSNTIGFKSSSASFGDIYPSTGGSSRLSAGLGVSLLGIDQNFNSGGTTTTGQNLDLMIGKDGFFIVTDPSSGTTSYTRAGHFQEDKSGYVMGTNGRLQGYLANNGVIDAGGNLGDLQIDHSPRPATATSTVTQNINLDSSSPVIATTFSAADPTTYTFQTNKPIYDSLGNEHTLSVYYVKSASNTWTTHVLADGTSIGSGSASFNTNGTLSGTTGMNALSFTPSGGATTPQVLNVMMTDSTQFAGNNTTRALGQNGYQVGNYTGFQIDSDGNIDVTYTNGERLLTGKVAVAQFPSTSGLASIGKMSWVETGDSGAPILNPSNSNNAINQGTLELSNVDLTQEMINLIGAQHSFQANAQVEQVYNEVMQTVIKI